MAILHGHTAHEQDVPDMAYEAHTFAHYARPGTTRVYEVPTSENPHKFQATGNEWLDEVTSLRLYEGKPLTSVDMQPRAQLAVKTKFPVIDKSWRTSDKPTGRMLCAVEGCLNGNGEQWWCASAHPDTLKKHNRKKHGGA